MRSQRPVHVELMFVDGRSTKGTTIRDQEIDSANRRAHAARISHRRRKQQVPSHTYEPPLGGKSKVLWEEEIPDDNEYYMAIRRKNHDSNPLSLLCEGNSDPFNSVAIVVTPQVNKVVCFVRDVLIPTTFFTPYFRRCAKGGSSEPTVMRTSRVISSRGAIRDWNLVKSSLHVEVDAVSCIAGLLSLMGQLSPAAEKDHLAALKMQGRAAELLRHSLASQSEDDPDAEAQLAMRVFWLFRGECLFGDMKAARVHCEMLRHLLERSLRRGNLNMQLMVSVLFNDIDMASKLMQRTILDLDGWFSSVMTPTWDALDPLMPPVPLEYKDGLDQVISTEPLKTLFIRTRRLFAVGDEPFNDQDCTDGSRADMIFIFCVSHSMVDVGIFVNHFLDISQLIDAHNPTDSESLGVLYTEACLNLAALCITRHVGHVAFVNGVDIRDARPTIMQHLRVNMIKVLERCTTRELMYYENAHLWILFIGALTEQQMAMHRVYLRKPWFLSNLVSKARAAGISTWKQLHEKVARFIYSDSVEPHGSTWFEEAMVSVSDQRVLELS